MEKNIKPIRAIKTKDYFILNNIKEFGKGGTMHLSKKIGIAHKNLLPYLNRFSKNQWVTKQDVSLKPKGYKRIYNVTPAGERIIKFIKSEEERLKVIYKGKD